MAQSKARLVLFAVAAAAILAVALSRVPIVSLLWLDGATRSRALRLPGATHQGSSYSQMTATLNRHLRAHGDRQDLVACEDLTHADLVQTVRAMQPLRSAELRKVYAAREDSRAGVESDSLLLEQTWASEATARELHPALHVLYRDALCHEAALLYVHHLTPGAQAEVAALRITLPYLPAVAAHQHVDEHTLRTPHGAAATARWARAVNCGACHSTVDPPPSADGPVAMPTNFNASIAMYDPDTGYYVRNWTYRYGAAVKQMHYRSLHTADPRSETCNILFEQDGSVWEWYEDVRRCAKVTTSPMMTPNWAVHAGMVHDYGVTSYTHPLTNATRSCHRYCAANFSVYHIGCYCQQIDPPHYPMKHTHEDPDPQQGGVTYYSDLVETPELANTPIGKPAYCPPAASLPAYAGDAPHVALEKICLRCWISPGGGAPC